MKNNLFFLLFFISYIGLAQDLEKSINVKEHSKITYVKFDFSIPISANQYQGEISSNSDEEGLWYLIDGLSTRFCLGAHHKKWIGAGINIGLDWKESECLVVTPLFASFRLSPKVGKDIRITADAGYGRALALSGYHLSGFFKKLSLGVESDEGGFGLYIEFCNYGFYNNYPEDYVGSFSFGINYIIF
jgi:hypothetical protein